MPYLFKCIFAISLLLMSTHLFAKPVQTEFNDLLLNANLEESGTPDKAAFLIVHGTWATYNMNLMRTLQTAFDDWEYTSLAITLSLNESDRNAPHSCDKPVLAGQNDNVDEIGHWIDYLENKGYKDVVLVGHSRGGAQLSTYFQKTADPRVSRLVLLAPMAWDKGENQQADLAEQVMAQAKDGWLEGVRVSYCKESRVPVDVYKSFTTNAPEKNTATLIKDIKIPVNIYWGTEDKSNSELFYKSSALIDSKSNILIHTIDGADHFFNSLYSDEVVEHLLEQLE